MVPSGMLEPQPANVRLSEGSNQEFHLEQQRHASARQSQMGHTSAPNLSWWVGDHRPKDPIGGLVGQAASQRPSPGGEPWKEFIRHKADQIRLPMHGKGPNTLDINWLFAAPKLKRIRHSMWKNIVGSWLKMRSGLVKADPTSSVETLRQPLFGNPSILNANGASLGLEGLRDGNAFAKHGCTRIKDLWNHEERDWKGLSKPRDELPRV
ncbi:unnamed protein product [Sphagnum jensenii]|uniref:Uncharacterized protein n=1 Tax=Sphagnum jensenii TaxID=128206 RepID=A0ABP1B9Z0_9BRYO